MSFLRAFAVVLLAILAVLIVMFGGAAAWTYFFHRLPNTEELPGILQASTGAAALAVAVGVAVYSLRQVRLSQDQVALAREQLKLAEQSLAEALKTREQDQAAAARVIVASLIGELAGNRTIAQMNEGQARRFGGPTRAIMPYRDFRVDVVDNLVKGPLWGLPAGWGAEQLAVLTAWKSMKILNALADSKLTASWSLLTVAASWAAIKFIPPRPSPARHGLAVDAYVAVAATYLGLVVLLRRRWSVFRSDAFSRTRREIETALETSYLKLTGKEYDWKGPVEKTLEDMGNSIQAGRATSSNETARYSNDRRL